MKKKIVGFMAVCLMFGMVSVASATLIESTQDWIDTSGYGTSVSVVDNQVNSEFWGLTNFSQMSSLVYYYNDPGVNTHYAFGITSPTDQYVEVFNVSDTPVDFATSLHFYTDEVFVSHYDGSVTSSTQHDFSGDTFSYWMGKYDIPTEEWSYVYSSNEYGEDFLSVQVDVGSYLFSGDFDGDGMYDMIVQAESVAPVPEPATMLLFGTGLAGMASMARRRKNSTK